MAKIAVIDRLMTKRQSATNLRNVFESIPECVCHEHEGTISLMVTDVVMPQMSGRELAERATLIRPDMKVLSCPVTQTTSSSITAC